MKVLTLGYTGTKMAQIRELIEREDLVVIDTRYSPFSRAPVWQKASFQRELGTRYLHIRDFGNLNYRGGGGGEIRIASMEGGLETLDRLMDQADAPEGVLLICACEEAAGCHRTTVARGVVDHYRLSWEDVRHLGKRDLVPDEGPSSGSSSGRSRRSGGGGGGGGKDPDGLTRPRNLSLFDTPEGAEGERGD